MLDYRLVFATAGDAPMFTVLVFSEITFENVVNFTMYYLKNALFPAKLS